MSQAGNNNRISGRFLIQENDHMSEIVRQQGNQNTSGRQADQGQSGDRQQGQGKDQRSFNYENPRQVH